ncbi:hypothetical protein [Nocardia sp. CDC160]|uniref:hypothetical protein n=1 Tax=Nocardia sp. CDC160 TaxID=3112166 RepID=UPI002DBDC198|nr:hypothetical protein [Nocardia sp. CDC160]MEC3914424.1 hypothetical protein [Nocardia sp. CDC160]
MKTTRTSLLLSMLPIALVAGQGVAAAAPGQPGLAVPGDGQPGLSTQPNQPPANSAPSPADWIPDPPVAPPNRPRPKQQTTPQQDTIIQPQTSPKVTPTEPEATQDQPAANAPEVMPADPHQLRVGTGQVELPDFIDTKTRDKAQAYLDMAEWQIAAAYDRMGFSRDESDRMAASSSMGALLGAGTVGVAAPAVLAPIGCGVGAVVGALAGAAIAGVPTAGVGAPAGAIVGGIAGCVGGGSLGGMLSVPLVVGGGALAALGAGALSGGDATKPAPAMPTALVDTAAQVPLSSPGVPGVTPAVQPVADFLNLPGVPAPVAQVAAPVVQQVAAVVDQQAQVVAPAVEQVAATVGQQVAPVVEAAAPVVEQAVTTMGQQVSAAVGPQAAPLVDQVTEAVNTQVDSFRTAVAQMPALTPDAFLAALQPAAPGA